MKDDADNNKFPPGLPRQQAAHLPDLERRKRKGLFDKTEE